MRSLFRLGDLSRYSPKKMPFNPLPEFLHENGDYVSVDLDIDDDLSSDPKWLQKIKHRVGSIVIEFNALEKEIDEAILDIMNERAEDARIWVFLENMPASRKINSLFQIYDRMFEHCDVPESTKLNAKSLNQRINELNTKRNLYVHASWLNTINEMVEHRTRRLRIGTYGRIRRKISISEIDADIDAMEKIRHELSEFHYETVQEMFC